MRNAPVALSSSTPPTFRRGVWTTHYIDVSNNNGAIDWRSIASLAKSTGITGAAIKASEGPRFVDDRFAESRLECARYGLRVMPYHFARPDASSPAADADNFCRCVSKLHPWEWRPMLDFETPPFHAEWARQWAAEVKQRLGSAPVLYSYYSALLNIAPKPLLDGLVIAYPNSIPGSAPTPHPWRRWVAHQYSWTGEVIGVHGGVDLNYSPAVYSLLAFPVKGLAYEPVFRRRRRRA